MGTVIPLGDASRRPLSGSVVTALIILVNAVVFVRVTLIPAALLIGVWFLMQLVSLGTVATTQTGGVAYVAHISGMLCGALCGRFFESSRRIGTGA